MMQKCTLSSLEKPIVMPDQIQSCLIPLIGVKVD